MENNQYGFLWIFIGMMIIYLKIKRKWIFKEDEDSYESFLSVKGWLAAVGMVALGLYMIFA